MVVLGCYMPPNYPAAKAKEFLDHITDVAIQVRRKHDDPFLVISGDFNQWDIKGALADYQDLEEVPVGLSRRAQSIDRTFTSFSSEINEAGALPTLEMDCGKKKK